MELNTQGLVIRERTVRENDKIISILTKNDSVINAYVFGAKKLQSRLGASTQLFALSDFSLKMKKDLYTVEYARTKETFYNLRKDIESLALAQYFAQLEEEFAPLHDNCEEFLRLMLNCLHIICMKKKPLLQVKAVFEMRIMCLGGYMPDVMMCKKCGKYEDNAMYYNFSENALFCPDCYKSSNALELGILRAIRHICYSEHEKLFNFTLSDEGLKKLSKFTEEYILMKTNKSFKTLEFYRSLI